MSYGIKGGYTENPTPRYFIDDVTTVRGTVYQPDVYTLAELLAVMCGATSILDVGCGWGDKLAAMAARHDTWDVCGVDYGPNLDHCFDTYPDLDWWARDLERVAPDELPAEGAIVICSDVIEHLVNPVPLLQALRHSGARCMVLSTPERDVEHGYDHMGPSPNECHVREWNAQEFKAFLESEGLTVDHIGLTRGNDGGYAMGTILVVAH